jgi:stage II sporulation protein D
MGESVNGKMPRVMGAVIAGLMYLAAGAAGAETIRVAVVEKAKEVRLSSSGPLRFLDTKGASLPLSPGRQTSVRAQGGGLAVGDQPVGRSVRLRSSGESLAVDGVSYPGEIEIRAAPGGLLQVVNHVDIETYVAGVVPREVPAAWDIEVLKAQAVLARTYALSLRQRSAGQAFHIGAGVDHQAYSGESALHPKVQEAVRSTRGEVLAFQGELAEAVYHAYCGGVTENAADVWGRSFPYLQSVRSECRLGDTPPTWTYHVEANDLARRLRAGGVVFSGAVTAVEPADLSQTGRIRTVRVRTSEGPREMRGIDFRKAVGPDLIKSTRFTIEPEGGGFRFAGLGSGHGVGLCQHGARAMADGKAGYREILARYFPGTAVTPWSKVKRNGNVRMTRQAVPHD